FFFFQAEDGIRDFHVTGVQTCALPIWVALVGRPNVGKSSLLNRLAGEDRVVVDAVAGTTVDPVDTVVMLDGEPWLFVDTAGLRRSEERRVGKDEGAYYGPVDVQERTDQ